MDKEDRVGAIKADKDGEARVIKVVRAGVIKEGKEDGVTKVAGEILVISRLKGDSEVTMDKEVLVAIREEIQTITTSPTITHRTRTRALQTSIAMGLTSMCLAKFQNLLHKINQNNWRIPSTIWTRKIHEGQWNQSTPQ